MAADAIVVAVRAAVGTRFRPQGRMAGVGLDCVGVALIAARAAGCEVRAEPYALGGDHGGRIEAVLGEMGCRAVAAAMPGDLLLLAPSPRQRHLAVVTPAGVVHAHAGLGSVVEGPLDPGWTIVGAWRLPGAI
jgi:hypothetical protein